MFQYGECFDEMKIFFFYHGTTAPVGQGLLIGEDSWSHSDTSQSVGLLWTSDQSDAETCTWQQTDIHASGGTGTHNPSKKAAAPFSYQAATGIGICL